MDNFIAKRKITSCHNIKITSCHNIKMLLCVYVKNMLFSLNFARKAGGGGSLFLT